MNRLNRFVAATLVAMALVAAGAWTRGVFAQSSGGVLVLSLDGPLTPAFKLYLERGLPLAERDEAALVILQLRTPGGEIGLMNDMVDMIRNSPVPVVVFVAPRGSNAWSAGTVITLAGHASAMAPETSIGAASPVGGQGEDLGSALESKVKEALKAKVRVLAARRSLEAVAFAESTIDAAKAATAEEAYEVGLVDFLADDVPDLLQQLEGFSVEVAGGARTLHTRDLTMTELPMNLLETVLNLLNNPNIVSLLLSLGGLLIWVEVSQPGGWVAGFLGVVCLAFALYGLSVLPVNWFGIVFILIAFVLFVMDVFATSHGALTVAAAASFIVGALVLFNSSATPDYFRVNVPLVVVTSLVMAGVSLLLLTIGLRAQRRPVAVGAETLVGQVGEARSPNSVQVAGELWSAEGVDGALEAGEKIEVAAVKGLRLLVKKKKGG